MIVERLQQAVHKNTACLPTYLGQIIRGRRAEHFLSPPLCSVRMASFSYRITYHDARIYMLLQSPRTISTL